MQYAMHARMIPLSVWAHACQQEHPTPTYTRKENCRTRTKMNQSFNFNKYIILYFSLSTSYSIPFLSSPLQRLVQRIFFPGVQFESRAGPKEGLLPRYYIAHLIYRNLCQSRTMKPWVRAQSRIDLNLDWAPMLTRLQNWNSKERTYSAEQMHV